MKTCLPDILKTLKQDESLTLWEVTELYALMKREYLKQVGEQNGRARNDDGPEVVGAEVAGGEKGD